MSAETKRTQTLFVLGGGGLPGIDVLCGQVRALEYFGIRPDHIIGTSAGAIVGALLASGKSTFYLEQLLRNLRDRDVLNKRTAWKARAGWLRYWIKDDRIRKVLEAELPRNFETLQRPFMAVATDLQTGRAAPFSSGPLVPAVLASMAINGIFRRVRIQDRDYCDGGTSANLPLPGNWQRYGRVFLCIPGRPYRPDKRHNNIIGRLLQNVDLYAADQVNDVLDRVQAARVESRADLEIWPAEFPKVYVLRPDYEAPGGLLHFDHSLISEAYNQTLEELQRTLHPTPRKDKK